jgi:AI-2 transport protein TqsA
MADRAPATPPTHEPITRSGPRAWPRAIVWLLAFAVAFWLLSQLSTVLMPVVTALLLALAVWPLVSRIQDRMPRHFGWVGPGVGVLLVLLILAVILGGLWIGGQQLYALAAELGPQLQNRLDNLNLPAFLDVGTTANLETMLGQGTLASSAFGALNAAIGTAGVIVLIVFLMLLMLTEADAWHAKIDTVVKRGGDRRWLEIGRSVGEKFRAYFVTRFVIGLITAVLYVAWLAVFGVEYLLLWGILTVLLNFVPTVGSIISGTLPVIYVLITRDFGSAMLIGLGLLAIEQVMGNFVDPKLMGRRLSVSPLVVLVSLIFWSLVWGLPGAFLAVPLTVLVTTVMAHIERTRPAALMLTDCTTMEQLDEYRHPN